MRYLSVIFAALAVTACTYVERERPPPAPVVLQQPAPAVIQQAPPTVTVRPSY
ncbi:hypothetical protein [Paracraurococcus ruber]|uniref:hypothetical protein n=1 Tax=Paracraurococcus ruber TaxID=77675 RepID=UPI0013052F60|nr:hypothetical protein [Paracraurococcus ruber]